MNEQREYSIPKDLFTPTKFFGLDARKLVLVVIEPMGMLQLSRSFFPASKFWVSVLFVIVNFIFMLWLVFPFNKMSNFYAVKLFFTTRRHSYKSIEHDKPILMKIDKSRNRMHY